MPVRTLVIRLSGEASLMDRLTRSIVGHLEDAARWGGGSHSGVSYDIDQNTG